jgi:hypothetical protein
VKNLRISGIITALTILFFYQNMFSQEIGVSLGIMKNYSPEESSNSAYSFYPEISISNNFFSQYLNWELAFGYLNDGLDRDEVGPLKRPYIYYNSKDYILSLRLILNFYKITNNKYTPQILVGFSTHIIESSYVYPNSNVLPQIYVPDKSNGRIYFDIGAEYEIAKIWGIAIVPRYIAQIPLSNSDLLHNKVKNSFVLSFKY